MEKIKVNLNIKNDDELLTKMYQEYLKCPTAVNFIKKLGIPEEKIVDNIPKIYDMVQDINYCKNCPGVKKCAKENPLVCTTIVYKDGFVDRSIAPCKKMVEKMLAEKQFLIQDFPDEMFEVSLGKLDKTAPRLRALQEYFNFDQKGINKWIYLKGATGSGRSFFAAAIACDIAKKKKGPIVFMNAKRFLSLTNDAFQNKDKFAKELEEITNVPVLVIDDFGNEPKTDFSRDAIVLNILTERANKRLFTILTSNFSIKEIALLYATSKQGEIRAKQLGQTLIGMSNGEIDFGSISVY